MLRDDITHYEKHMVFCQLNREPYVVTGISFVSIFMIYIDGTQTQDKDRCKKEDKDNFSSYRWI